MPTTAAGAPATPPPPELARRLQQREANRQREHEQGAQRLRDRENQ